MLRFLSALFAAMTLVAAIPGVARAVTVKEEKPGLLQRAKVSSDAAIAAAKAKVPQGEIVDAAIEEEKGKLIYSFDMKVKGKEGIDEVEVDAMTGTVLSVRHESEAEEEKEKEAEGKTRTPKSSP